MFGQLEYVMTLDLHRRRRLARASAAEVRQKLEEQGYYLQLPPGKALFEFS
jgi:uncharacterized protein YcgL (UPF0745 family)